MSKTAEDVRAALVRALEADLIGPFLPDPADASAPAELSAEILPLPPSRWYLTGFLAPQGARAPDEDDTDSQGDELAAGSDLQTEDAGTVDPEPKRPNRFPASMGLSVFLPAATAGQPDSVQVDVRYAYYDKVDISTDTDTHVRVGWQRVPQRPPRVTVPLTPAVLNEGVPVPESVGLRLRGELRETQIDGLPQGARILSLFLVNDRTPEPKDRDLAFVFQVGFTLHYAGGFLARPNRRGEDGDADQKVLALLFRDRKEWAVGHNTSPQEAVPDADGQVRAIHTTQLPRYEVKKVDHVPVPGVTLSMKALGQLTDGAALERALTPLVEAYGSWIDQQRAVYLDRPSLDATRTVLVGEAAQAKARLAEGIALLRDNAQLRRAFNLANEAMHVQALQADTQRPDPRYRDGKEPLWRPFQLAFLLLNVASVADPAHADRRRAELIYFPTGGGKTEAYLGLIAFTLLLRRLRGKSRPDEGRGVAVVLRYTLRLLTLDQLGRAATLVCALEQLRNGRPAELGNTRFTVGLWVGRSATANTLKEVQRTLSDFSAARESPFPLASCPWCGDDIKTEHIKLVDDDGKPSKAKYTRVVVYCGAPRCEFNERKRPGKGLPLLFVDEQIYVEVPDFLVATVDKFAMVPWRGEAGMLFGRATHLDAQRAYGVMHKPPKGATRLAEGLLPPELIVQDEMHLISGPLGTMVGLYEAAVDYLCERAVDGVRRAPKVVCSTATVRRAREQIRALFGRDMAIFPPRGIDDGDNFFARVNHEDVGRLYVGVAAPGRALRGVSVRTYATLLAAAEKHFDRKSAGEQAADPYMTLVGYFNSLRELGGMRRLVEDEVRTRVAGLEADKRPHGYVGPHPWAARRTLRLPAELTSREKTEMVKETKQRLATEHRGTPPGSKARGASGAATEEGPPPVDVVLASNMISVGLDVERLGLMVVTGQPKTTSEYIQATSRVGRRYAGLVVTCLNVSRPRDRSHYERFVDYHESFYRDVEATSVTPFSGQVLDRGMVGTLLTMIRHGIAEMQPPRGVQEIHAQRLGAEQAVEWLVERARGHREWKDNDAEERIAYLVRQRGRHFLDAWERVVDSARAGAADRIYSKLDRAGSEGKPVMFTAVDPWPHDADEQHFQAGTSMRDVEPSVHVWLRYADLDKRS